MSNPSPLEARVHARCFTELCGKTVKPGFDYCRDCINGLPLDVPEEPGELRSAVEAVWRLGGDREAMDALIYSDDQESARPPPRQTDEAQAEYWRDARRAGRIAAAASARRAEAVSDWRAAETFWRAAGAARNADAARGIGDATELGDAWRALPEPRPNFRDFALSYKDGALARRLLK